MQCKVAKFSSRGNDEMLLKHEMYRQLLADCLLTYRHFLTIGFTMNIKTCYCKLSNNFDHNKKYSIL